MSAPSTVSAKTDLTAQSSAVTEPTPSPPQSHPHTKPRLLYVDNLRVVLISMVVLLHLAIAYGASGDWWCHENVPESILSGVALTLYTTIAQAFTLAFFFMIDRHHGRPRGLIPGAVQPPGLADRQHGGRQLPVYIFHPFVEVL
jgi:hypothetical protein